MRLARTADHASPQEWVGRHRPPKAAEPMAPTRRTAAPAGHRRGIRSAAGWLDERSVDAKTAKAPAPARHLATGAATALSRPVQRATGPGPARPECEPRPGSYPHGYSGHRKPVMCPMSRTNGRGATCGRRGQSRQRGRWPSPCWLRCRPGGWLGVAATTTVRPSPKALVAYVGGGGETSSSCVNGTDSGMVAD